MSDLLRRRLLDTTRGRIVELLQLGSSTADELASQLGVSRSAIRVQLTAMERDGVVVRTGTRAGTTRPSHVFELTPESRQFLSKAYLPLLGELVSELETSLTAEQLQSLLRRVGKRLARGFAAITGRRKAMGDEVDDVEARHVLQRAIAENHVGTDERRAEIRREISESTREVCKRLTVNV